jgi:FkbM family methyltransferase
MQNLKKIISKLLPLSLKISLLSGFNTLKNYFLKPDQTSLLTIERIGNFDIAYRKDTADEGVISHSFENDIYFGSINKYSPKKGDIIIDLGAHIGSFSLLVASKIGDGKVYAIEASKDSFNLLKINIALNNYKNISAHHVAITDKNGMTELFHSKGNWGHSTVKKLSNSYETVVSQTLSTFLQTNSIAFCHFMKLNCEGGEFPILMSATTETFKKFGSFLILYHCDLYEKYTEEELLSHLKSNGFICTIKKHNEKRGWIYAYK